MSQPGYPSLISFHSFAVTTLIEIEDRNNVLFGLDFFVFVFLLLFFLSGMQVVYKTSEEIIVHSCANSLRLFFTWWG